MKRFYFPKNIYDALKQNPDLPIKDIQHITNCARSTAYRYKSNYNFCIKNPDIVATIAQQEKRPFMVGFAAETRMLKNMLQGNWWQKNLI